MIRKILGFSQDSVCKKLKPRVNYLINLLVDNRSGYNSNPKIGKIHISRGETDEKNRVNG